MESNAPFDVTNVTNTTTTIEEVSSITPKPRRSNSYSPKAKTEHEVSITRWEPFAARYPLPFRVPSGRAGLAFFVEANTVPN